MLPPGLCRQAFDPQVTGLPCRDGGFLTWAAKPSVRESPTPANISLHLFASNPSQRHLCTGRLLRSWWLRSCRAESSTRRHLLGRSAGSYGSKKNCGRDCSNQGEHWGCVLYGAMWRGHSCPRNADRTTNAMGTTN